MVFGQEAQGPPKPPAAAATSAPETAPAPTVSRPAEPPAHRPNRVGSLSLKVAAEKVARYPDVAYLLIEYGNLLLKAGRINEADAAYSRATELRPDLPLTWHNLGVARHGQRRYAKARRAYRRAIKLDHNYALAHYNLGVTHDAEGNYAKALSSYQRAIELDPGLLDVKNNPQVVANRHLAAILIKSYVERGGSVLFPVQSAYPRPSRSSP
jgi:tetratricopeptide (TPR) repeat protein